MNISYYPIGYIYFFIGIYTYFPWNLFLINFQGCKQAVLSHGNSNVGVFL